MDPDHHPAPIDPEIEPSDPAEAADVEETAGLRGGRRRHRLFDLLFAIGFVAVLGLFLFGDRLFSPPPPTQVAVERTVSGTWVSITAYAARADRARSAIEAAFTRMQSILDLAAGTDSTRELARLNTQGHLVDPSADLWAMVTAAVADTRLTSGAFDLTAAPLDRLWNTPDAQGAPFSQLSAAKRKEKIDQALRLIGADRIELKTSPEREILLAPGTTIALAGIATGYAVDQGLAVLKGEGIVHALITAGGEAGAMGGRPGGKKWVIPLRDPRDTDRVIARFVLEDGALATVGDPGRYFDPSEPVPLVVDPRTGTPATGSSSATVISSTCMQAQPLATAAFTLGPARGIALVDTLPGVEALLIGSADPQTLHRSQGLEPYLETKDET